MMDFTEKQLSSETVFAGKIMTVRRDKVLLPDGTFSYREVVDKPAAACVLPLYDDMTAGIVRQFRYPYGRVIAEAPAGKVDRGEQPIDCARRELKEETGLSCDDMVFLGEMYPSDGFTNEIIYLYLARGLHEGDAQLDEGEFLSVERVPFNELYTAVISGEIKDAKTIIAVLKTAAMIGCK